MPTNRRPTTNRFRLLAGAALLLAAGLILPRLWGGGARAPLVARAAGVPTAVEKEGNAIAEAIRQGEAATPQAPGGLIWPAKTTAISDGFGPRLHPILHVQILHAGMDIAAQTGEAVLAAGSGKVLMTRDLPDYGRIVIIDHGGKLATVYAHLSAVYVQQGQAVHQRDRIGLVGATGQVTGPHLHFEVRRDGVPHDPLEFVRPPG